ncbi:MAG: uncharacterized protein KVP18_003808 [Porospora cf. gigantea A]|uniref:uncharacterized protein n=1 Tax=Porospora cf. gigantea A TaxID=2853593 RepID=UPI0035595E0F|nr:MAG: hypothetical protein KVP18_003808 [Porospora cf. gigantea A]
MEPELPPVDDLSGEALSVTHCTSKAAEVGTDHMKSLKVKTIIKVVVNPATAKPFPTMEPSKVGSDETGLKATAKPGIKPAVKPMAKPSPAPGSS